MIFLRSLWFYTFCSYIENPKLERNSIKQDAKDLPWTNGVDKIQTKYKQNQVKISDKINTLCLKEVCFRQGCPLSHRGWTAKQSGEAKHLSLRTVSELSLARSVYRALNGNSVLNISQHFWDWLLRHSNRNDSLFKGTQEKFESSAIKMYLYFLHLLWFLSGAMGDVMSESQRKNETNPNQRWENGWQMMGSWALVNPILAPFGMPFHCQLSKFTTSKLSRAVLWYVLLQSP